MTVREFMQKHKVSRRTVYRLIENQRISARKVKGQWHIPDETEMPAYDTNYDTDEDKLIEQLQSENKYLRKELTQAHEALTEANQTIADMQNRHDTIVLNLTKQVEQKTLALEDKSRIIDEMQNRSWWRRVKIAFGFSGT